MIKIHAQKISRVLYFSCRFTTGEIFMRPEDKAKLKAAVRRLVRAEIAASWKGGAYVEDVPIIEAELRASRIVLSLLITRLAGDAK